MKRGSRKPSSPRLALLAVAALLVLGACARDLSGAGIPADASTFEIVAAGALAGADLTLSYEPGAARFLGLASTRSEVLARAYDDGAGTVRIALVSADAITGSLVAVSFAGAAADGVTLATSRAFRRDGSSAAGSLTLSAEAEATTAPTRAGVRATGVRATGVRAVGAAWSDGAAGLQASASLTQQALAPPVLEPSFANYLLGDLDKNGTIDVLDVLKSLDIALGASAGDDFQRYSADLLADDVIDTVDVVRLLDKAVDPELAAAITVKPSVVTYLGLGANVPVLVGNSGNAPLDGLAIVPSSGVQGIVTYPLPGQSGAFVFDGGPNQSFGAVDVTVPSGTTRVPVGNIVVVVAGQSNAAGQGAPLTGAATAVDDGVRMLGNDYVWKLAAEPLDRQAGQLDMASYDDGPLHSFGVRLGNDLRTATGRHVYLIPTALGGSNLSGNLRNAHGWDPVGVNPAYDRDYLSGSAVYRGLVSAGLQANPGANVYDAEGGPVRVVAWYQGESDSRNNVARSNFIGLTKNVFNTFDGEFNGAGIVYAQLAAHGKQVGNTDDEAIVKNRQQADVAERQRRMEQGAEQFSTAATEPPLSPIVPVTNAYMVVTHDLPLSDQVHLSAEGQRMLGDRIALAVQEHILGLDVDGTGPRLVSIGRPTPTTIRVKTTRTLNNDTGASAYEGYFTVFDGVPNGADVDTAAGYGTNRASIQTIQRDPSDPTAVLITLTSAPAATPYVRYMPPALRPFDANGGTARLANVVQDSSTGLPLPSFGPLAAQ